MEARQNVHFEAKPPETEAKAAETVARVVTRIAELSADVGWEPVHLALFRGDRLDAAMPLYVKHHTWGEFVFDWAWADAYRRHGLAYYPKLVSCVPFSPVPGPRLLAKNDTDRAALIQSALKFTHELGFSSFHILFPT